MARGNFKSFKPAQDESKREDDDSQAKHRHGKCEAWGCNRMGHVHTGKWHCRYHFACHGKNIAEQLSHVTLILKNHEPEINWYEKLLGENDVEWVCGDLKKRIPVGMEAGKDESFKAYRDRIELHINALLSCKVIKADVLDRKRLASGEKPEFNNFADLMPDF